MLRLVFVLSPCVVDSMYVNNVNGSRDYIFSSFGVIGKLICAVPLLFAFLNMLL